MRAKKYASLRSSARKELCYFDGKVRPTIERGNGGSRVSKAAINVKKGRH
jgi:hypothetical protein